MNIWYMIINYQFHECMVQDAQLSIAFKLINLYICDMSSDLYCNNLWLAQLLHPKSSCHQIIKIHYACNVMLVWILIPCMLPVNSKFHIMYSLFIKLNSNLVNSSACNKIQWIVLVIYMFTLLDQTATFNRTITRNRAKIRNRTAWIQTKPNQITNHGNS